MFLNSDQNLSPCHKKDVFLLSSPCNDGDPATKRSNCAFLSVCVASSTGTRFRDWANHVFLTECVDLGENQVNVNISLSSLVLILTLSFIYKYEDNQKYLRPYEDPVPVVEDITGMRILKGAFLLFGGDEKRAESGSCCPS